MRYMLIMTDGGADGPGPAQLAAMPAFRAWIADAEARGVPHTGVRLRPAREAVTVRVRDGDVIVGDGPFADTKEQVGGFELVDCRDLDEAIELASAHPSARWAVEIRPCREG